jgi:hypothetical protein
LSAAAAEQREVVPDTTRITDGSYPKADKKVFLLVLG